MATKSKKKGKTMALTDFLAGDSKLVTVRGANWSEIVDSEEAEAKPIVVDIGGLPTAPRAADYSTISYDPPFIAYVANLSFEIDDEKLRRIFGDLNPKAARIIKDGTRSKGTGLVEFGTRDDLIEALKRTDKEVYGRKMRVNVSEKHDSHHTDGGRGGFGGGQRANRGGAGEERSEMASTWRRAEPRSEDTPDERPSSGFNRDRTNRNDNGRSNMGNGPRDNKHGNDFGFGYTQRGKEDRIGGGGGGNRDYNRQGQRNRHHDDDNRVNSSRVDRPAYGGRYSDTRDTRDRNRNHDEIRDDQAEPPRERQRLQLQPRTKPLEEFQPLSGSSSSVNNVAANARQSNPDESTSSQANQDSTTPENQDSREGEQSIQRPTHGASASIFGGAKPVDTTAKEAEIERKMKEATLANVDASEETEEKKPPAQRHSYNRSDRDNHHRERRDNDGRSGHGEDYHHKREYSGGRQYEDEGRRRNDDDHHHPRRGTGNRYSNPTRRDHDSNRPNKYNHSDRDNERGNYRNRNHNTNNYNNNEDRPSNNNNNFNSDSQLRHPTKVISRRTLKNEDDSNRLQLSNKFGMLGDEEDLDDENEHEEAQSPSIEE